MNQVLTSDCQQRKIFNAPTRDTYAVITSAVLHSLILLSLTWFSTTTITAPRGVARKGEPTVIELGFADRAVKPRQASIQQKSSSQSQSGEVIVAPQKEAQKKAESEDRSSVQELARFGLREGAVEAGELGELNGYQANEEQRYIYELRMIIENRKSFPPIAKQLGESGRIIVKFIIQKDGTITDVELKGQSPHQRLNMAAMNLIKGLEKYKPLPNAKIENMILEVPIEYVIR